MSHPMNNLMKPNAQGVKQSWRFPKMLTVLEQKEYRFSHSQCPLWRFGEVFRDGDRINDLPSRACEPETSPIMVTLVLHSAQWQPLSASGRKHHHNHHHHQQQQQQQQHSRAENRSRPLATCSVILLLGGAVASAEK
eukprot:SAG31_NODE_14306_length_815_cov_1.166201_1_plen_137_part_00